MADNATAKPSRKRKNTDADPAQQPPPPSPPQSNADPSKIIPYCADHRLLMNIQEPDRKVCPYGPPAHDIPASEYERHLKVCNFRPKENPTYFKLNVNVRIPGEGLSEGNGEGTVAQATSEQGNARALAREKLSDMSTGAFNAFSDKIQKFWGTRKKEGLDSWEWTTEVLEHSVITDFMANQTYSNKFLPQNSSLLGHMNKLGLLNQSQVFMEFGCGQAEFSHWIHEVVGDPSSFILVDRAASKWKVKAGAVPSGTYEKIRIDIKDLWLEGIENLKDTREGLESVVAYSKHLCGSATDLTLRCLQNYLSNNPKLDVKGVELGFLEEEFHFLTIMSSWAVCGRRAWGNDNDQDNGNGSVGGVDADDSHVVANDGADEPTETSSETEINHYTGLSYEQRRELGLMCKAILDLGRSKFLMSLGFKSKILRYISNDRTPENAALLAWR
ncbi:tRNA:m(4)X modification enzyme TRM13 [Blyttiomyces sp. JEL0837]|nr:tRNA:m(4)X modification enzyme TRM13 [Blyttiomyces sp. JEL0837]